MCPQQRHLHPPSCTAPSRTCSPPHRFSSGTTLASRHTAPATTGLATLVPLRLRQPPPILEPCRQGRRQAGRQVGRQLVCSGVCRSVRRLAGRQAVESPLLHPRHHHPCCTCLRACPRGSWPLLPPASPCRPHLNVSAVRHHVGLAAAVAQGHLPGGHASGAEGRDLVGVVDAADADDVVLVGCGGGAGWGMGGSESGRGGGWGQGRARLVGRLASRMWAEVGELLVAPGCLPRQRPKCPILPNAPSIGQTPHTPALAPPPPHHHHAPRTRVVQRAVQRAVVADGGDHDDACAGDLSHLLHKRLVQVVGAAWRRRWGWWRVVGGGVAVAVGRGGGTRRAGLEQGATTAGGQWG